LLVGCRRKSREIERLRVVFGVRAAGIGVPCSHARFVALSGRPPRTLSGRGFLPFISFSNDHGGGSKCPSEARPP